MKFAMLAAAAALVSISAVGSVAQAAIVADGDFSNPTASGNFTTYYSGQTIGPWTVTGTGSDAWGAAGVDLIGNYWQAPTAGGGSVDLDGLAPGGVSQGLNLTAGSYQLSFYLSGNPDGAPATKMVDVSVGSVINDPFSYTIGTNSRSDMQYTLETVNFTATGPTTLSFSSADTNSPWGPVIGGVSVAAVPEPATWAMMLVGIGGLGVALRSRRKPAVAAA